MLQGYLPQLIGGAWITIQLAICALLLGLMIGMLGAVGETSKKTWVRYIFVLFHSVIRGVPELVIIFFVYFAGSQLINVIFHTTGGISSFVAGVIALALLFGAYSSQTLRGAFAAIQKGQTEAAKAVGLNLWQTFWLILLPQAWRHALPGLGNLWLVLLKDTALVSLIGLSDLMMRSQAAAITTGKPFTFYCVAASLYLMLTSISEIIMRGLYARATRHI